MTADERRNAFSGATKRDDGMELQYLVRGFNRLLYLPAPKWPNCRFEQREDLDVILCLSEANLTPETDLDTVIAFNDVRVRQLVLAWEFQLGQRLQLRRFNVVWPTSLEQGGHRKLQGGVAISDHCQAKIVHAQAPVTMPQVSLSAERWVRTFSEAGDFSGYVEEQLRRHYLIVEELWETHASRFDSAEQAKREEIRLVRNFVSHSECTSRSVVTFITANLPSAQMQRSIPAAVRFDRSSQEHQAFVARFAVDSERIARKLVRLAINAVLPAQS